MITVFDVQTTLTILHQDILDTSQQLLATRCADGSLWPNCRQAIGRDIHVGEVSR